MANSRSGSGRRNSQPRFIRTANVLLLTGHDDTNHRVFHDRTVLAGQSTAEITVRWPHGQTQVFDAASVPGFPHLTLTDTSDPEIQSSTVTASYIPSSGYTTHTYSWKSTYPGGYPQVLVTTGNKPTSCLVPLGGVNQLLLTQSTSGVSVNSEFVDGEWLHTVTWITVCAGSCTYTYYVRNVVGGQVYSSTPKILNVSVCADITE